MTCIVGLVDNTDVWMGGDSAGCSGWDLIVRSDPKIFDNDRMLIGFTTSYRMGQLLRYCLPELPPCESGVDLHEYMVRVFIKAVRETLKDGGYAKKENEREEAGAFLVGINGRLFHIDSDYQVIESACKYDAIGSGEAYAKGSLYSTHGMEAKERILLAMQCAEEHSAGVRGPFIVKVRGPTYNICLRA